jgi:hypothetical protein
MNRFSFGRVTVVNWHWQGATGVSPVPKRVHGLAFQAGMHTLAVSGQSQTLIKLVSRHSFPALPTGDTPGVTGVSPVLKRIHGRHVIWPERFSEECW